VLGILTMTLVVMFDSCDSNVLFVELDGCQEVFPLGNELYNITIDSWSPHPPPADAADTFPLPGDDDKFPPLLKLVKSDG
jgi:hypothetical protein